MRGIGLVIALGLAAAFSAATSAFRETESPRRARPVRVEAATPARETGGAGARVAAALEGPPGRSPAAPSRDEPFDADDTDDAGAGSDSPIALVAPPALPAPARVMSTLRGCVPAIVERDFESNPLCRGRPRGPRPEEIRLAFVRVARPSDRRPPDLLVPGSFPAGAPPSPTLRARRPSAVRTPALAGRTPGRSVSRSVRRDGPVLLVQAYPRP